MNFFEHQDAARRRTGRLVVLFGLAVVAIIGSIYLVAAVLLAANSSRQGVIDDPAGLWNPSLLAMVAIGCGTVILLGSLYRTATLGAGGKVIAETLGGRLLDGKGQDWRERRLLNVVEEMALAAGMPVPAVYVMDGESGINAFAAGFTPADAVVGVTRGTITSLTRDELQGVIAHEFSHILNGDMRLNLRLVGVLHGILLISLIGYYMMRAIGSTRTSSSSRSGGDKKDGGSQIVMLIMLFGVALAVIGYIGVFFGKLIKSAVSRQREYLADASAVQFTRDPLGIGGALKKIGAVGSKLANSQAEQASHMFFGNALGQAFLTMLATHPPLVDRVRRIEPTFDGDFNPELLRWPADTETEAEKPKQAAPRDPLSIPGMGKIPGVGRLPGMGATPGTGSLPVLEGVAGLAPHSAQQAVKSVGEPEMRHLDFAAAILESIPAALADEIHDPAGAAAVVYALLLVADESDDEPGLRLLARQIDLPTSDRVRGLIGQIAPLGPAARLPLAQLTMTALRRISPTEADRFRQAVVALIRIDRRVSLFEYCLQRLIIKHLLAHLKPQRPQRVRYKQASEAAPHVRVIIAALAYAGHADAASAEKAFQAGIAALGRGAAGALPARESAGYSELDAALDEMATASGDVKRQILEAAAAAIAHDGQMTIDEAELLRTVADALDCPMPPPAADLASK